VKAERRKRKLADTLALLQRGISDGTATPDVPSNLGKLLLGLIGPHQKMILAAQLNHLEFLDQQVVEIDQGIEARLHFFTLELERLEGIYGIGRRVAEVVFSRNRYRYASFSLFREFGLLGRNVSRLQRERR